MRLLRLDLECGPSVDLHPFVTVVAGLDEVARHQVVAAVRQVARGSTAGVSGLVQHQGLLVELDGRGQDWLSTLTMADVVVDTEAAGGDDLTWLRAEIDRQRRRAEIEAVIVEEIRADLDPSARVRVAELERQLAPFLDRSAGGGAQVWEVLDEVEGALTRVEALPPMVQEAAPGIASLRKRWARHQQQLDAAADHLAQLDQPVERARARLEAAQAALAEAEQAAIPVLLTREEEARLELLSFPSMDESRRGRWRKQLKPDEKAEQAALLAKVGVESWTAYTVYRMAPTAPADRQVAVEQSLAGVADAKTHLAEMEATRDGDPVSKKLAAEGETLRAKARVYLGLVLPNDLAAALENAVIELDNREWIAACDDLEEVVFRHRVAQLPRTADLPEVEGVHPRDARRQHRHQVVARTREWLDQERAAAQTLDAQEVNRRLEAAQAALDRHHRALARIDRAEATAAEAALGLARLDEQLAARSRQPAGSVEAVLGRVEPVAAQASLDARGSLPVVVVGELEGLDDIEVGTLLDRFSELSSQIQIVVLTDHRAAAHWADQAGLNRALLNRGSTSRSRAA